MLPIIQKLSAMPQIRDLKFSYNYVEKFISDVEEQFEKLRDYLDNKCE